MRASRSASTGQPVRPGAQRGRPDDAFRAGGRGSKAAAYAAELLTAAELSSDLERSLDRVIGLFDVLALLAVVIAGLGIVNTLAVSVLERAREIAILRSHGMTTGQVQAMVVAEAAIIGAVGGLAAVVIGGLVAWARHGGGARATSAPGWPFPGGCWQRRAVGDRRRRAGGHLPRADRGAHPDRATASRTSSRRSAVETRFWEAHAGRAFVGRLATGNDLVEEIERFCAEHDMRAAWVSVVGAVSHAAFAYYEQDERRYLELASDEHHEITGFIGNISMRDGRPFLHAHASFANRRRRGGGRPPMPGCKVFVAEVTIREMTGVELSGRPTR